MFLSHLTPDGIKQAIDAEIFCLDLAHPTKWFKSKIKSPHCTGDAYECLIDKEQCMHLIKVDSDEPYHFKISLPVILTQWNLSKMDNKDSCPF